MFRCSCRNGLRTWQCCRRRRRTGVSRRRRQDCDSLQSEFIRFS